MANRQLKINIFRYNPCDPESKPHFDALELEEWPGMTLYTVLYKLREEQDPSLQFDFACRAGVCGSCGMVINGRPGLACKTLTSRLPTEITLAPMPVFKLIGDLSVDTGVWFHQMHLRTESWIHADKEFDPKAEEQRMDNETAVKIYEADRCIECGVCVAACGTALMREDFLGATGIYRVARFLLDPRDERAADDYLELVGTDEGVFGCMGLMGCDDLCPKGLPLQAQLAYVRRKLALAALGRA